MARHKRVVLEGPAAEAVERLAESAGVSPAEIIKRALRREDDAQRQTPSTERVSVPTHSAQVFVLYLDTDGIIRFHSDEQGDIFRIGPRPAVEDFRELVKYLAGRIDIIDGFTDSVNVEALGTSNAQEAVSFRSSASFAAIDHTLHKYFAAAGYIDHSQEPESDVTDTRRAEGA